MNDKNGQNSLRITWNNKYEFALNVIGLNVGLGNIWRFTYLCFKDGGGAFLIPYLLVASLCGVPIIFIELAVGQFTRRGCIAAWDILPLMRGIGYSAMLLVTYFSIYYALVIGWCILFLVRSFTTDTLPWATCENYWNTKNCISIAGLISNKSSALTNYSSESGTLATAEFWDNYVLRRTSGIDDLGGFSNWPMLGCFISGWIVCYLCIVKGIRTSGKVAYLTVLLPYLLMIALLVRGVTLEGAGNGVRFYLIPNMTRLSDPEVWLDAGSQVIYSLGLCGGTIFGFGSYNKRTFDCYKSAYLFVGTCCGSSLLFGFVVFSFLGHMAFIQNLDIEDVVEGGPGLVFQVIPAELSFLPFSQLWSVVFFIALLGLGVDGLYAVLEGSITALADYLPDYFAGKNAHYWRAAYCCVLMLLGLPQLFDGGIYIFEILNMYGASGICILTIAFSETVAIAWIYGIDRFFEDVTYMIGYRTSEPFKYCIKYVTPSICLAIFIACCIDYSPLRMGDYIYPLWANLIGWMLTVSVVIFIPLVAAKTLLQAEGNSWKQRWRESIKSNYIPSGSFSEQKEKNTDKIDLAIAML